MSCPPAHWIMATVRNFTQHLINAQHEQPVPIEVVLFENYLIEQIDRANQERGSKRRVADDLHPDGICERRRSAAPRVHFPPWGDATGDRSRRRGRTVSRALP